MVTGALGAMRGATTIPELEGRLFQGLFPIGIRDWTFLRKEETADDNGQVVAAPITMENIEDLLPLEKGGFELIEFARERYMPRLGSFLAARIGTLSVPGPTDGSMPPTSVSGSPPPAPSQPSSRTNGAGKRSAAPAR